MSRYLRKGKSRATLRQLSSPVLRINVDIFVSLNIDFSYYEKGSYKAEIEGKFSVGRSGILAKSPL
jgi:hypothetical protein